MNNPKKPIKNSPLNDPSERDDTNETSNDDIRNKESYDEDDDDFDMPLDDLDNFGDYGADDEDDY